MKPYAAAFYKSKSWRRISKIYMESKHYICERCGSPATICHHKRYITPGNIGDPNITLNVNNLECLCIDCHNREHIGQAKLSTAVFNERGEVIGQRANKETQEFLKAREKIFALCRESPR